jgi:hypothetical protein
MKLSKFFQLLLDLIAIIVILASIFVALFVAITTKDLILPPSPTVKFNTMLVNRYVVAEDWPLIHYIEEAIDLNDLNRDMFQIYAARLKYNYFKSPQEYRDKALLGVIYQELEAECFNILANRQNYKLSEISEIPDPFIFDRGTYEYDSSNLLPILSDISLYSKQAEDKINSGNSEEAIKSLNALNSAWNTYQEAFSKGGVFFYYPEYLPIVYECFDRSTHYNVEDVPIEFRVSNKSSAEPILFNGAREIMFNPVEDVGLRLRALFYLGQFTPNNDRISFIDDLYKLSEDSKSGKHLIQNYRYTTNDQAAFEKIILIILRAEVYEEKYFQELQASKDR